MKAEKIVKSKETILKRLHQLKSNIEELDIAGASVVEETKRLGKLRKELKAITK